MSPRNTAIEEVAKPMTRICIVTPDVIGPVKNGGIGTHCYNLARTLAAQSDTRVAILFTGPFELKDKRHWHDHYAQVGIEFLSVEDFTLPRHPHHGADWFVARSLQTYELLRARDFDVIHFQEWQANGFISLQAKRLGEAFAHTTLTVTMHSSSEWVREGMQQLPQHPILDAKLDYMERYCCAQADLLLSPSHAMFEWATAHRWEIQANRQVVPYCMLGPTQTAPSESSFDDSRLIFFGRLETRKGLRLFCDAIDRLVAGSPDHGIRAITFLGKEGLVDGRRAKAYLTEFAARVPAIAVELVMDQDSFQAMALIRKDRGLVVMPSLLDNYPFTILECIENNVAFIASNVGGIPEMVDPTCLFAPTAIDLARALSEREQLKLSRRHKYTREAATRGWLAASRPIPAPPATGQSDTPLASVCVAYYNYGRYLPQLLKSLANNTHPRFEVIVANDGSTDAASNDVFEAEAAKYAPRGWKFLKKENGGIGQTRNFTAEHASGRYLIFMDADNIAMPTMIADFVHAMQRSGVDCLTCHFQAFEGDGDPSNGGQVLYKYLPIGPCIEVGAMENVFGDANFCVTRAAFSALNGFTTDRTSSYEDWEFLATLSLKGFRQDVIPKPLFWYRYLENGFSRATNLTGNFQRVLRPYAQACPPEFQRLITGLTMPMYHQLNPQILASRTMDARTRSMAVKVLARFPGLKRSLRWGFRKAYGLYRLVKD